MTQSTKARIASLLAMLLTLGVAVSNSGCNGASESAPISVSLNDAAATVEIGATMQFTATVTGDSANGGVTWSVSCSAAPCGSVSPTSTASGAPTTYTPPSSQTGSLTVSLIATSASDSTKSATATITLPALMVSLSVTSVAMQTGTTASFSATVIDDGANKGVTWTVSCSAAPCGSISPAATASGAAATYAAPTSAAGNLTVVLTATSATDSAVSASATIAVTGIVISIAPSSASVESGGTQQFTATVTNDPSNGGVTWSLVGATCHINILTGRCGPVFYVACSVCGTVSPTSTASGAPVTYTAPPKPPTFRLGTVILATSVTNSAAVGSAGLSILPISVSVSPSSGSVALNSTQQFTATVTNDGTNSGVTWSLTQNAAACSPSCGTISPTSTASGEPATYTPPVTAPASPLVTVNATSVEDTTKSAPAAVTLTASTGSLACSAGSGSESLLTGQYAFLVHGFGSQSNTAFFYAGSITADGTGKITAGEEDIQPTVGQPITDVSINAAGSSYAVGADRRGCALLTNANGETTSFVFALGSINGSNIATSGHVIEVDDTSGSGAPAAGTIRLQDATAFTVNQFTGAYAFGVVGGIGGRVAMAGTFTSDGISAITSGDFDFNAGNGETNTTSSIAGSFTCCSANGRGMLQTGNTGLGNFSFVMYVINSGDAFLIGSNESIISGEAVGIPSGTNFNQASLNGAAVVRETAQSSNGPVVDVATASADGKSVMTVNDNINNAGTFASSSTALNYAVASNGRVTFTGESTPPVLYLYGPNQGFLIGTDPNVTFGILELQAAGPFSNTSFSGAYTLGTENPAASTVTMESGVVTADGSGNVAGTADQSSTVGLPQVQALNFTYSFPANGVGNIGSGTTAILISGNKLVFINNTSVTPTITVVEQ
jgi:hypothetical protein